MFLICGETLFDVFASEAQGSTLRFDAVPGGSPFNVAVGLARLGCRARLLTGLSTDFLGDSLARAIRASGIELDHLVRLDAPTTLGFVNRRTDGSAEYAFYGNGAADRQLTIEQIPALPADVRAIHLGSYSAVVEPVASAFEALVRRESESRFISYDPNVRLGVMPDPAVWRAKIESMAHSADLIKISDEDFHSLYGDAAPAALAAGWLAAGCALVVLTRGADGLEAWTKHAHVSVDSFPVPRLIDTVGAGDTVQAALLAHLDTHHALQAAAIAAFDGDALRAMLRFASKAAAVTCGRKGADMPRRGDLH